MSSEPVAAPSTSIALTPPEAVPPVPKEQADQLVSLTAQEQATLETQVHDFVGEMLTLDTKSPLFSERVQRIVGLGNDEIARSASISNRMLQRPIRALKSGSAEGSEIGQGLAQLRTTVERLDPRGQGDLFSSRKLLGIIPFGSKIKAYFQSFESAQSHLNAIVESLYHGKDELLRDNASIDQERAEMWSLMQKLTQFIHLGKSLDARLSAQLDELDRTDPARAKLLREEVLFPMRQKVTDLLTQMAVNAQGYLALDMVKRNNVELIKGVDRATTTTLSALRTAVIVAQALTNQRLTLDHIKAMRETTGSVIEGTAQMLRQNSVEIMAQASDPTVDVKKIESAFDNIYATMGMISDYRVKALSNMQTTVNALSTQVEKANAYLNREQVAQETLQGLPSTPNV
ncbi:MAG TPA: toxic anion resistance protein [Candidatus Acidoferrales bacterium]|nr:toxic anion resistance protein [Candidatus Acidoferrales bacterium]